jgi:hypothetical protein
MKRFIITILFFLLPSSLFSEPDTVLVRLDKSNSFILSTTSILPNSNLSIISLSPNDTFLEVPAHDSNYLLFISGDIGAETGEALLSRISKPGYYPNKDHLTSFSTLLSFPKIPLSLNYKYLYTDEYTDRFDSIWINYANATRKKMQYDEDGLRHEHLVAMRYQQQNNILLQASYNWYRRWNATPYFFSPVLSYGYSLNPLFTYSSNNLALYSNWLINKHSEYYDHIHPTEYTDVSFTNKLSLRLSSTLSTALEARFDPALNPGAAFCANLLHDGTMFNWNLSASIFNSNDFSLQGYGSLNPTPNINCSLSIAKAFIPESRHFIFMEYTLPVSYNPISTDQIIFYGSATYKDTLFIPVSVNTWFQHNNKPIWESITFYDDSAVIKQMHYKNGESVWGLNGNCQLNFKSLYLDCHPSITIPLGNTVRRFTIQKMLDIKLTFSPSDSNIISGSVKFHYRDSSYLNYILSENNDLLQTFTSPSQTALYFQLNIPFMVPFIHRFTRNATLFIDAGPLRLSKTQRLREHPRGNQIGPAIYTGLKGNFW